ncbi:agglutinin-like [Malania oleifera]|uniref:agglutinin-like n=1 Tax=Malania oleifera TaxID=397392 RepID=UPI0025AE82C7|nr:agglutinin-like [Malania oleifera]
MGIAELEGSISTLAHRSGIGHQANVARSVIICIVLTSEAARLRYVEGLVIRSITQRESFVRNGAMVSLIRHYKDISEQIQQSNQGAFTTPLALQRRDYSQFTVSSVAPIISSIGIMMFVCNNPGPRRSSDNQLLRDMPVNAPEQNHRSSYCVHPEPTVAG